MMHDLNKVATLEEFFEWFADWSYEGDTIEVEGDGADKTFKVYNGCQYLVAEFNESDRLRTYK